MTELLEKNIAANIALPESEKKAFCSLFKSVSIPRKHFLLSKGDICRFEGFVVKGLFKVYHTSSEGFEQILYFASENWWITDIDSFTNETPSQLFIEALEESEILVISKQDKEFAYANIPQIEKLFRVMTQKTHVALQRRMIDNLSKTAELRYVEFTAKYPQLVQRLSNIQIAAYLGITNVFLSNIRKKITSRK